MHVTLVHVHVKPERVEEFVAATRANHEASVRGAGQPALRRPAVDRGPVALRALRGLRQRGGCRAHKGTAHYAAWRDRVADMMAEPRRGVPYAGLLPVAR